MEKYFAVIPKKQSEKKEEEKLEEIKSPIKTEQKVLLDSTEDIFKKDDNQNSENLDLMKPSILAKNKLFYDFEDFVDQLGSWKSLLKNYTGSAKFVQTHKRVKGNFNNNWGYLINYR